MFYLHLLLDQLALTKISACFKRLKRGNFDENVHFMINVNKKR